MAVETPLHTEIDILKAGLLPELGFLEQSLEPAVIPVRRLLIHGNLLRLYSSRQSPEDFMTHFVRHLGPWRAIPELLSEVSSWVERTSRDRTWLQGPRVQLMTLAMAKGLEAQVVCVVGLEDGLVPRTDGRDLAEQSRLLYVSMTRAINELHLFHARKRSGGVALRDLYRGGRPDITPSRFLQVISKEHCERLFHPA